jgi:transcriptional regulator with XRE-family HTH domain
MKPIELKARRLALGMSQSEFALALGNAQTTVSAWEKGSRAIPGGLNHDVERLEAFCAARTQSHLYADKKGDSSVIIAYADDESFWRAEPENADIPNKIALVAAARALIASGYTLTIVGDDAR